MLEQLGEPLPLPYLIDQKPRNEDSNNESLAATINQLSDQLKRRKIRIPSGPGFQSLGLKQGSSHTIDKQGVKREISSSPKEPLGFPLRTLREADLEIADETILDELERKICVLKQDIKSPKDLEQDLATLQNLSKALDEIQNRKYNDSILNELERLQHHQVAHFENGSTNKSFHWMLIMVVSIVLLLVASFLAGQFSYEYCYYFC